jgi:tripartite-type tricarboxylate transporter receptor subunit TctC
VLLETGEFQLPKKHRRQSMNTGFKKWIGIFCFAATPALMAQPAPAAPASLACPDKNVQYWQAFPPGGESDLSARHQQVVLKKKCPVVDTIIQYKAARAAA